MEQLPKSWKIMSSNLVGRLTEGILMEYKGQQLLRRCNCQTNIYIWRETKVKNMSDPAKAPWRTPGDRRVM